MCPPHPLRYAHTTQQLLEWAPLRSLMVGLPAAVEAWRERLVLRADFFRTLRRVACCTCCARCAGPSAAGRALAFAPFCKLGWCRAATVKAVWHTWWPTLRAEV